MIIPLALPALEVASTRVIKSLMRFVFRSTYTLLQIFTQNSIILMSCLIEAEK